MQGLLILITRLFPVWAILLAFIAYYFPSPFTALKPAIVPLLATIMLCMGLTLTFDDFRRVVQRPLLILLGTGMQFLLMPLAAYLIARGFDLPLALMTGMVLVGASSGGTASNVICYLAKGDVALSISLTLCSTLLAAIAMPALTWFYIGERVPVPVWEMVVTVLKIVIAPVCIGVLINHYAANRLKHVRPVFPLVSVIAIVVIVAIIVALNQQRFNHLTSIIVVAVVLHNSIGLLGGYWLSRILGYDKKTCRTLAIEVGMQNSGLSVALAMKYFSALAALPGAIFSVWHNISGSLLAGLWSKKE